ncbi:MAG: hypothetical protein JNK93_20050 [Planctomycetia bacterium]|nr:hypothetical protein [Planctomycetia bacterium]
MLSRSLAFLALAVALGGTSLPSRAQPKPALPTLPPQFPTLTSPANLGVRPGATTTVTLGGTNLGDATEILVSIPGAKATIAKDSAKPASVGATVEVPKDAPVGLYQVRVVSKHGISNARPISVDDLPEVEKKPGNNKKAAPMPLPGPCVVTGAIAVESSDFYLVKVAAGQRMTFEALARRIGSPLDPVVILHDAKSGREMPALYADDTPGLQSDARVTHLFAAATEVIVEIRDTTYRGGGDYVYRLRIGDAPGATTAFPLAVEKDKTASVGFAGPGLDGVQSASVKGTGLAQLASPRRAAGAGGWSVPVLVSPHPELVEAEPNNEIAKANKIPVPGGVSGRFEQKGDFDYFAFSAKKGQKIELVARTYEINSPAEVLLKVVDAKGAELARSNPAQPTARAEFTPAADGEFFAVAEHLNYGFGPSEIYHLTVRPTAMDFEVAVGMDRIDLSASGTANLPIVGLTRLNGFNLPIELSVVSDALTGTLTIPPAANPQPATPLLMRVSLKSGAKPGLVPFTVKATAKIDGKDVAKTATIAEVVRTGLAALPNIPREMTEQLYAYVAPEPLVSPTVTVEKASFDKGTSVKGKVVVKRAAGFAEEIAIAALGLPANVTAKLKPIAKGANEAEFEIVAAANAAPGAANIVLRFTAKSAGRDFAYEMRVPDLTVTEPKKAEPPKKEEPKKK